MLRLRGGKGLYKMYHTLALAARVGSWVWLELSAARGPQAICMMGVPISGSMFIRIHVVIEKKGAKP